MALIFQNLIVPGIPSLQGVGKLLPNDAVKFDSEAWQLATDIKLYGWSKWTLFSSASSVGNVSIVAALYAIFGHDPSLIIPVNASFHALGGVLIFLLAKELAPNKVVGNFSGMISAVFFIIFPSSLMWYGQLHKDGYAIAGTLLLLLVWVKVIAKPENKNDWLKLVAGSFFGVFFVGMVRPYGLTLLLVAAVGAMFFTLIVGVINFSIKDVLKQLMFFVMTLIVLYSGIVMTKNSTTQINLNSRAVESTEKIKWEWQNTERVPDILDRYMAAVATVRFNMILSGTAIGARSMIDTNETPRNIQEIVLYLPRAFQIAVFSPFPNQWLSQPSAMRLIAVAEMLVFYICIVGMFLLLWFQSSSKIWMVICFSSVFLLILGFTIANMGTLFRLRYAYLQILMMLGLLGWVNYLDRRGILNNICLFFRLKADVSSEEAFFHHKARGVRKKAVGSGLYVMCLTFIGFLGFFYRDVLMAQVFGLTSELDDFFIALLIPMTVVTIVCIPIGTAFTPVFMKEKIGNTKEQLRNLISTVSGGITFGLFFICITLYFLWQYFLPYFPFEIENIGRVENLILFALPLLFFSGSVILGNAILNAEGKVIITGAAQLVVPFVVIIVLMFWGDISGVKAVMFSMVIGQLINLGIVQFFLIKLGYTLRPQVFFKGKVPYFSFASQYFPLVASAFFVSMTILINTLLAMGLPEGGVSTFNLGNKVVLLITGLIGAVISTVMLPYFSLLIERNNLFTARKELSVFVLFLTFFFIPIAVIFFVWAIPITNVIFANSHLTFEDIDQVAKVMQYAVIQVPFFACNILLLRFSVAMKHVYTIMVIAFLGLVVDVIAVLVLMRFLGVAGVALGASISIVITTIFLVASLVFYRHISLMDFVVIIVNWLLFITFVLSVYFDSSSGMVITGGAYFILLYTYSQTRLTYSSEKMDRVSLNI